MVNEHRLTIGEQGSRRDYVYEVVDLVNHGIDRIKLIAVGDNICKLVDVVAELEHMLPGNVTVKGWKIDSRRVKGERKTVLELVIEYKPPI
ncbi:MAG: hypothetical protein F7C35_04420 [Desulfurococcales archaeon]|nr:hypothetical protein [Desulfurococcales archaeon]